MGIEACEEAMPGKPNVAVWDTGFGMSMPEKAYMYAIPHEYYEKYSIRRYGFHGTSHMFVSGEAIKFGNLDPEKAKVYCLPLRKWCQRICFYWRQVRRYQYGTYSS